MHFHFPSLPWSHSLFASMIPIIWGPLSKSIPGRTLCLATLCLPHRPQTVTSSTATLQPLEHEASQGLDHTSRKTSSGPQQPHSWCDSLHVVSFFKTTTTKIFLCYIGVQLIHVVIVSGGHQKDSAIHTHVPILPQTPSCPGRHTALSRVPSAKQ